MAAQVEGAAGKGQGGLEVLEKDQEEWIELKRPLTKRSNSRAGQNGQLVTMTGTVARGGNVGQAVEVQLELSEGELRRLTSQEEGTEKKCGCGLKEGLHILLATLLLFPLAFLASTAMCFYLGTLTWYNIYCLVTEERPLWQRATLGPLLVLTYPFTVGLTSVGLGIWAACRQVSWSLAAWRRKFWDFDNGFFSWLCRKLHIPECAPYEVVVLNESTDKSLPTVKEDT